MNKTTNEISFKDICNASGVCYIKIIVNNIHRGTINYAALSGRIYWEFGNINTLDFDISFASFEDAKISCENTLKVFLNNLNPEVVVGKKLLTAISKERKRLAENMQVPVSDLTKLVFCAYNHGEISEGKAAQLLNVDRLKFRELFQKSHKTTFEVRK